MNENEKPLYESWYLLLLLAASHAKFDKIIYHNKDSGVEKHKTAIETLANKWDDINALEQSSNTFISTQTRTSFTVMEQDAPNTSATIYSALANYIVIGTRRRLTDDDVKHLKDEWSMFNEDYDQIKGIIWVNVSKATIIDI